MIGRVRAAVAGLVGGLAGGSSSSSPPSEQEPPAPGASEPAPLPLKYPLCRPALLQLSPEQLLRAADHAARAVQTPRGGTRLPWDTGYAEVINSGKSQHNEDQACCEFVFVACRNGKCDRAWRSSAGVQEEMAENVCKNGKKGKDGITFLHWGLFDGHAGPGAAIMASKLLHLHICDQLRDIVHILQNPSATAPICLVGNVKASAAELASGSTAEGSTPPSELVMRFHLEKEVSHENLVMGAIENAFKEMDDQIEREKLTYSILGGCCALAVVYLMGKLYVANAGDSRAIIIRDGEILPMTREFTPESERQRLQHLGFLKPELLGNDFTHLEFPRRIQHKELGKRMLYRDQNMTGWAYKTIQEDDLKFPLIYGEGKKARVMATIGVTRGLGDHDLKVYNSSIHIKPFLSCFPEVRVYDLAQSEHNTDDVMVLGTDGLWDVLDDKEVAEVVNTVLSGYKPNHPSRFTRIAEELVSTARGMLKERGWRMANDKLGSGDDISVFVIPLGGPRNCT
ncbi:protein phosphatase 1J [Rhinatrema bivittatum]|uniref:protein phosphatase 1J n=1 Tax=Rhinatrema bivittatum TaxID=194408 RepID=UPI00112D6538|nr:protein phosphatase 1J [Rhinatrema bivittatum]